MTLTLVTQRHQRRLIEGSIKIVKSNSSQITLFSTHSDAKMITLQFSDKSYKMLNIAMFDIMPSNDRNLCVLL